MADLETYREDSRQIWNKMAPGWQARREWMKDIMGRVNDRVVERAAPEPGQTFLDIAAGVGDLGLAVARRVGDDGKVISTDFAQEMVEEAHGNGDALGLTNLEYRQMDAEKMDLDDDSVDGVVCRYGYMLMADPAAALAETRRVLRDGGPLSFAVWCTPDRNPWAAVPGMTLVQLGHMPPPEPGMPGIFAMGDPDRIRSLTTGAGFGEPEVEEIEFEFHYADGDDLWDAMVSLAGPLARVVRALPEDEQEATRTAVLQNMAPWRGEDDSYTAPAAAWVALAR